jgi:plasmid maintenance system killer protein
VIQSFRDETAADLFRDRNTRAPRRIPRDLWRVVQRTLKLLDAAGRLDDLLIPAGNRYAARIAFPGGAAREPGYR